MTEPKLTQTQLRALFAKKKGITIKAKGTIPIDTKTTRDNIFRDYDIEKVQGTPDTVVIRPKGSDRGILTSRKELNLTLQRFRNQRKNIPTPSQEINKL